MMPYEMHKEVVVFGIMLGVWIFFHYIASWGFGLYYAVRESLRRRDIDINCILQMTLFAFIGALAGARILAFFGPWSSTCISGTLWQRFILMFSFHEEGWVEYGGMIGGFLFAYLGARLNRKSFLKYIDLVIPSVAIGMSIARIGCFIAGCCYGSKTNVPWAIIKDGTAIHPVQLYLSMANMAVFLIVLYLNEKREREGKFDGYLFFSFLTIYPIFRFFSEFLRGDYVASDYFYSLTSSQWVSIAMFAVFAPTLIWNLMKEKPLKKKKPGFHIRATTYLIIILGGLLLNTGAYIATPMPYLATAAIFAGLAVIFIGINSIFRIKKSKRLINRKSIIFADGKKES